MANVQRDQLTSDCFFHIYNRSADRQSIFREDADYRYFIEKYHLYFNNYFDTYAFCLMPNHFHFVVKVKNETTVRLLIESEFTKASDAFIQNRSTYNLFLADQMRRLMSSTGIKFNKKYDRKGSMFARNHKKVLIENDDRLRFLIAYVHHNPIHHGFKNDMVDWRYSSYNSIIEGQSNLVVLSNVIELFEGIEKFKAFHDQFQLEKETSFE